MERLWLLMSGIFLLRASDALKNADALGLPSKSLSTPSARYISLRSDSTRWTRALAR